MSRLNPTQASVTAAVIYVIGQAVAFVPSLSGEQQNLISIGSLIVAIVFAAIHLAHLVVDVVRDFAAGKVKLSLSDVESGVRSLVQDELSKTDLTGDVEKVLSGRIPTESDLRAAAQAELRKLLGEAPLPPAVAAPATPAPSAAPQG